MLKIHRFFSCLKRSWFVLGCVAVIFGTGCGSRNEAFIDIYEPKETDDSGPVQVHYFFKRNESMRGFVGRGEDSDYVQVLDYIWKSGDYYWEDHQYHPILFYEYGTLSIDTIPRDVVQNEMKTPGYYGTGAVNKRTLVKDSRANNRGPFGSVVD